MRIAVRSSQEAPAFQQIFISRVLNERMLEPIIGLRRPALHQQDIGVDEFFQRCLQRCLLNRGHSAQQRIREIAANDGADLRHLTRRTEAVAVSDLECRRDRLNAVLFNALHDRLRFRSTGLRCWLS